jgi:hypothetical protein
MDTTHTGIHKTFLSIGPEHVTALALILALFFICAAGYNYYTPLWNPPDEERHFAYAEYIARHHSLPPPSVRDEETSVTQSIHPPLYYALASLCYRDGEGVIQDMITFNDGPGFARIIPLSQADENGYADKERSAYRMRILSICFSAITVCGIYLLALVVFPGNTVLASAGALFTAMNPQFLHIAASVSNENLSSALATACLLLLLRYLHAPCRAYHHVLTGMALGCMLLTKLSTLFYVPLAAGIMVWVFIRNKKQLPACLALIFCPTLLIAGWWYVRNWMLTGDPFLSKLLNATQPWAVRRSPLSLSDISEIASKTFASFFGYFGSFQIPLPNRYLFIYAALIAGGLAGLALLPRRKHLTSFQRRALLVLLFTFMGGAGTFIPFNLNYIGTYMGRYFFPVLAPIAIGAMAGLASLSSPRWSRSVLTAISLLLIILNVAVLGRVVKPAYAPTALAAGVDQPRFSYPTGPLGTAAIAQTFVSPQDNLSAIRVVFSSPLQMTEGEVSFFLSENGREPEMLHHLTLPLKEINDCTRYFFIFPPVADSKNKYYTFWFAASPSPENRLALWYEPTDVYREGQLLVNREPAGGDLCFTTYHFSGTHPMTEWQGRKETVLSQGMYVDVRELQLYYEQSKESRERTITHEKILRVIQAVENRSLTLRKENQ